MAGKRVELLADKNAKLSAQCEVQRRQINQLEKRQVEEGDGGIGGGAMCAMGGHGVPGWEGRTGLCVQQQGAAALPLPADADLKPPPPPRLPAAPLPQAGGVRRQGGGPAGDTALRQPAVGGAECLHRLHPVQVGGVWRWERWEVERGALVKGGALHLPGTPTL